MNLHHLELFYYVCRHGGISRAVRHMPYGIQQPAVSSQILALEQDLGVKLFDRQPFRLTADGKELYEFARPFFENAEAVANRLRRHGAPKLRIAASELVLRDHLPHVIEAARARKPELRFALRSGNQAEFEPLLLAGEIDLAITSLDSPPRPGIKQVSIVDLPLVLLVPKTSPIKSGGDLWAKETIEEQLICLPGDESITRNFQRGLKRLHVEWPTGIEACSAELVTRYVANGYGIGVTVDLPVLTRDPAVRAVPLPGFEAVKVAALWTPPVSDELALLLELIETRARQLWPVVERPRRPKRSEMKALVPRG